MKVGDRVRYSVKWRRMVCEHVRLGISDYTAIDAIDALAICGTIVEQGAPRYMDGATRWMVAWDKDDLIRLRLTLEDYLTVIGVKQS